MFLASILLVEFSIFAIARSIDLTYSVADGNTYVGTSSACYALTGETLANLNIKTVSVNGDSVVIITPTCQTTVISLQTIDNTARGMLENLRNDGISPNGLMFSQTNISKDGRKKSFKLNFSKANPNRSSFAFGQNMRSISLPDFPEVLARIIFDVDTITYIYYDGGVAMKPSACVEGNERQFLEKYGPRDDSNQMILGQGDGSTRGGSEEGGSSYGGQREAARETLRQELELQRQALDEARQQRDLERQVRMRERQQRELERQQRDLERQRDKKSWNLQQQNYMPDQNTILQQQSNGSGMYQAVIDRGGGRYDNINVMT